MQSLINVLALSSFVVSAAVVGGSVFLYNNKDTLIEKAKAQALSSILPSTPDVKIPSTSAPLPVPFPF